MSQLRTQPFGSRRSPANWGRVTAFARCAIGRLFGLFLATYLDGFFSLEPQGAVQSAYETINEWARLLVSQYRALYHFLKIISPAKGLKPLSNFYISENPKNPPSYRRFVIFLVFWEILFFPVLSLPRLVIDPPPPDFVVEFTHKIVDSARALGPPSCGIF